MFIILKTLSSFKRFETLSNCFHYKIYAWMEILGLQKILTIHIYLVVWRGGCCSSILRVLILNSIYWNWNTASIEDWERRNMHFNLNEYLGPIRVARWTKFVGNDSRSNWNLLQFLHFASKQQTCIIEWERNFRTQVSGYNLHNSPNWYTCAVCGPMIPVLTFMKHIRNRTGN